MCLWFYSVAVEIKNLLSLVPEADIKIVQPDLFGVVVVFFSFILYRQICFSLYIFICFLALLERLVWVWSHQDPSVSPHSAVALTILINKHVWMFQIIRSLKKSFCIQPRFKYCMSVFFSHNIATKQVLL